MGKKFNCDIIAKSTFLEVKGSKICQQIESSEVKSIVKNENLVGIEIESEEFYPIYQTLLQNNIIVEAFEKRENKIQFRIKKAERNKVQEILDNQYAECRITLKEFTKVSIIGYGIVQDNQVLNEVIKILKNNSIEIMDINLSQAKIEILVKEIENDMIKILHEKLIQKK